MDFSNMRIKCINLDRRSDRKNNMINLLGKYNLLNYCDFFKAFDGQQLKPTDELRKLFQNNNFGNKRGVIGCAMSHYALWRQLVKDNKYDKYLIFEDDINLIPSFNADCKKAISKLEAYDVLYLGHSVHKYKMDRYKNQLKDLVDIKIIKHDVALTVGGTFAYVITKAGACKFVKYIEKNGIKDPIDVFMFKFDNVNHYDVLPHLVSSVYVSSVEGVDSDIQYNKNKLF